MGRWLTMTDTYQHPSPRSVLLVSACRIGVVMSVIPLRHRVGKALTELSLALKHRCFDLFGSYGSTGVWVMPPGLRTLRIAARVCPFSMAAAEGQGRCLGVEESLGARGPRADG